MANVNKKQDVQVDPEDVQKLPQDVPADVSYIGMGKEDGKRLYSEFKEQEQTRREYAIEIAHKLSPAQASDWLDGLYEGVMEVGYPKLYARRIKGDFKVIIDAAQIDKVTVVTGKKVDEKGITHILSEVMTPETLVNQPSWQATVNTARAMRSAKNPETPKQGKAVGTVQMFRESKFESLAEELLTRTNVQQAFELLDIALTRLNAIDSVKACCGELIGEVRELESKMITTYKAHLDDVIKSANVKNAVKNNNVDIAVNLANQVGQSEQGLEVDEKLPETAEA